VEKLGGEEVTLITRTQNKSLSLFQRAAERYADITPDELERRRQRGWGEGTADVVRAPFYASFSSSHGQPIRVGSSSRCPLNVKAFVSRPASAIAHRL
jgi:hypothetical protein